MYEYYEVYDFYCIVLVNIISTGFGYLTLFSLIMVFLVGFVVNIISTGGLEYIGVKDLLCIH